MKKPINIPGAATGAKGNAGTPAFARTDNINLPKKQSVAPGAAGGLSALIGGTRSAGGTVGDSANGMSNDRDVRPIAGVREKTRLKTRRRSLNLDGNIRVEAIGPGAYCEMKKGGQRAECTVWGPTHPSTGTGARVGFVDRSTGEWDDILDAAFPRGPGEVGICYADMSSGSLVYDCYVEGTGII